MNSTDQRLENLAARARNAAPPPPAEMPFGFATRVIAAATAPDDSATMWARFSLAALPVAALATAACLWWSATSMSTDALDLAQVFIQTPLLP